MTPWALDALRDTEDTEIMKLDVISDPWVKYDNTGYTVMLKTLQQARAEGVWKPCLEYLYKWGKRLYCTDRGSETDMGVALDVGVFTISSKTQESFRRQRCLIVVGGLMVDCFPVDRYEISLWVKR